MSWKSKKGKKSPHLKRFSSGYINAGMSVDSNRVKIMKETKFKSLGNTVSYRDHLKSMGYIRGDLKVQEFQEVPPTLRPTMDKFVGIPDDKVPPIIANLRKLKELKQDRPFGLALMKVWAHYYIIKGDRYDLICFFSGARAYFVERDMYRMRIRMSHEYSTDLARLVANSTDPETRVKWKETLPITSDPPA